MPPFSFEQMLAIAKAFGRYELLAPGLNVNLALFLGALGKPGCELELSDKKHPDQVEYLHLRLPQYIGTIGNRANPQHQGLVFEAFLYFDHAGTGPQHAIIRNRQSIANLKAFEAYRNAMLEHFAKDGRKSISLSYLLKNRAEWLEILQPYFGSVQQE